MGESKNKICMVCTLLMLSSMVSSAAAYGLQAEAMCANADFKEQCKKSLSKADGDEPKDMVLSAFNDTVRHVRAAIKSSELYKKAATDTRTKGALAVCEQVLNTAVDDMARSFAKVEDVDLAKIDDYLDDVKVWISAGITCKDTCIDAFENTTGDTGEKIQELLEASGELLSNGLAIVTSLDKLFDVIDLSSLNLGSFFSQKRVIGSDTPDFVGHNARSVLGAGPNKLKPTVTVAKDGSGQHKTIAEAVAAAPVNGTKMFVIHIKAGTYKEIIKVPGGSNNVVFLGDGPDKTIISGAQCFTDGIPAFDTATLSIDGDDFMALDLTVENTAGAEGRQASAVRVSGDKVVFYNVHMRGYQSTLYAHIYRHFYRNCRISGTMDIIWGDAIAVFQNCEIAVREPLEEQLCSVTAQARNDSKGTGVTVIQNCNITAEKEFTAVKPQPEAYLGRPMKEYSRTIVMQSNIGGFIAPEGWGKWLGTYGLETLYYGEYGNRGPGSDLTNRVTWKGIQKMTAELAESFTAGKIYGGDDWIKSTHVPYVPGMMDIPK